MDDNELNKIDQQEADYFKKPVPNLVMDFEFMSNLQSGEFPSFEPHLEEVDEEDIANTKQPPVFNSSTFSIIPNIKPLI